jgi:manganese oxidase
MAIISNTTARKNPWLWLLLVAAFVVVSVGAWGVGRASVPTAQTGAAVQTSGDAAGYDMGVAARKIAPTGKLREFNLVAKQADWEIAPGVTVRAITYNGQVPGPLLRVTEGDTVRVTLKNELDKPTSIHWHGLHVPNSMDGVPPLTQPGIAPGQSFTYEFTAPHAGTFMYHSHLNAVKQVDGGLYGPLIIDPATPPPTRFDAEFTMVLSAWNTNNVTPLVDVTAPGGMAMPTPAANPNSASGTGSMNMDYNYYTINGKAYPLNPTWVVKEGDLVRVRVINIPNLAHPMHLHGNDFTVVAKDGEPIKPEQQQVMNTLPIEAGETYDIAFRADNPGSWVFHCHELHHTENNGVELGGLIQVIKVAGAADAPAPATP